MGAQIIPFPARRKAGPFAFWVRVRTRRPAASASALWGDFTAETVRIDPEATLADGEAFVAQFQGGEPFVGIVRRTGRDEKGRFVPPDDPREAWTLDCGLLFTPGEYRCFRILGRLL